MSDLQKYSELVTRLEFLANHPVIDEEREEVCDLAAEAIRDLERKLAAANLATEQAATDGFEHGKNEAIMERQELQDQLAAANLARERAEQHGKLLEDQLRRTQGYQADMMGKLERAEKNVAMWMCGCGWINGVNLAVCANCSRTITEGHGILVDAVLIQAQASGEGG